MGAISIIGSFSIDVKSDLLQIEHMIFLVILLKIFNYIQMEVSLL